jgi:indole-3-glycerol phosphate synthase
MILDDIVIKKRQTLEQSTFDLTNNNYPKKESFYDALAKPGLSIIGEIKKASPSKGLIKPDFNPVEIAKEYGTCVDAISVLTEEHFFSGSPKYLTQVHETVNLPIIRKDFIVDERQIIEARQIGASAILLIVAILSQQELVRFLERATQLDLDVLVETHDEQEVKRALLAKARIIGINNRDLRDFKVSLETTVKLRKLIPEGILVVSESGIDTIEDIKIMKEASVHAILVGESFMRCESISKKAKEFRSVYDNTN